MKLSIRISQARKEKRLSQQALADLVHVSRSALAQWEAGLSSPSIHNLKKVSGFLDVSFEWLATGKGNQYLSTDIEELSDHQLDNEIMHIWRKMNYKKKRAILNVMKAME